MLCLCVGYIIRLFTSISRLVVYVANTYLFNHFRKSDGCTLNKTMFELSYFPKGCIKTCLKQNECLILEMLIHLLIWTLMFTNTVKRVLCLSMTMTSDVNNLQLRFHTKAPLTKTSADNG